MGAGAVAGLLRTRWWWLLGGTLLGLVAIVAVLAAARSRPVAGPFGADPGELRLHLATVVDLTPGENRLAFGLTDRGGHLLTGNGVTEVTVSVVDGPGPEAKVLETVRARFLPSGWSDVSRASYYDTPHVLAEGFFTATVRFPRAGQWGLEFAVRRPGLRPFVQRILPNVLSESLTPPLGAAAPRSRHPTLKEVGGDLARLDSDPRLNDVGMHRVPIADAIRLRRPAVVLFASPGLDESRLSLPTTEILYSLYPAYRDAVEFIHVEVYDLERYRRGLLEGARETAASEPELSETAQEWGVQHVPWLFFIDRAGRVFAKLFGPVARSEVEETLRRMLEQRS